MIILILIKIIFLSKILSYINEELEIKAKNEIELKNKNDVIERKKSGKP